MKNFLAIVIFISFVFTSRQVKGSTVISLKDCTLLKLNHEQCEILDKINEPNSGYLLRIFQNSKNQTVFLVGENHYKTPATKELGDKLITMFPLRIIEGAPSDEGSQITSRINYITMNEELNKSADKWYVRWITGGRMFNSPEYYSPEYYSLSQQEIKAFGHRLKECSLETFMDQHSKKTKNSTIKASLSKAITLVDNEGLYFDRRHVIPRSTDVKNYFYTSSHDELTSVEEGINYLLRDDGGGFKTAEDIKDRTINIQGETPFNVSDFSKDYYFYKYLYPYSKKNNIPISISMERLYKIQIPPTFLEYAKKRESKLIDIFSDFLIYYEYMDGQLFKYIADHRSSRMGFNISYIVDTLKDENVFLVIAGSSHIKDPPPEIKGSIRKYWTISDHLKIYYNYKEVKLK